MVTALSRFVALVSVVRVCNRKRCSMKFVLFNIQLFQALRNSTCSSNAVVLKLLHIFPFCQTR